MSEASIDQTRWSAVDRYFEDQLVRAGADLEATNKRSLDAGLPAIQVTAAQGKLLMMLAKIQRARNILEIGTLGGYSTIWLARALPQDGRLISLEFDPNHARIAQENIELAGLSDQVQIRVGNAAQTLPLLAEEQRPPFDMIFIDADKPSNPIYFEWALKLSRPGTLIIADNVVRDGHVVDSDSDDPNIIGTRSFLAIVGKEPSVTATAIQTVGEKGYDGFAMILVQDV
jgi:predicted O-methyltransferase YrrM